LPADPPPLTREEVIAAYRLILGRPPESEEVIEAHRHAHPSLEGFGEALTRSTEFAARGGFPGLPPPRDVGPLEIETACGAEERMRLLAQLSDDWEALGEAAPPWMPGIGAPGGGEALPPGVLAQRRAEFYASGGDELRRIEGTLARIGRQLPEFGHVVDHGCGVGRLAVHLAPRLPRYSGCDISVPHLRLAFEALAEVGLRRTEFRRVTAAELMPASGFDLWLCCDVLQHNPPPLALAVLDEAFARLLPGGVALFQLPIWLEGYRFRLEEQLALPPGGGMALHALPQDAVLALADRHGCRLRDLREDNEVLERPGRAVSNVMTFQKRG
jgi:SAM-dependent methyltransferase